MGLLSYFRTRRARESAIPDSQVSIDTASSGRPLGAAHEINGFGDIGALLSQFQQFQSTGKPGGMQMSGKVVDMRGSGLREEILGALAQHAVEAGGGSGLDAASVPGLQNDIMAALGRHGIDLDAVGVERVPGEAGSLPANAPSPGAADGPQIVDPLAGAFGGQQIPGVGDMGDLGAMIQSAPQQGNATVQVNGQVIDLREGGMAGGMFEALGLPDTSPNASADDAPSGEGDPPSATDQPA